jgi:hypothetical protein
MAAQVGREAVPVQPLGRRVLPKLRVVELLLVLEEAVVHRPERALPASRLGGLSRVLGVRVDVGEREVPEDEAQPVAEVRLHLLHDRVGPPRVRALVVAVLHQGDRRVGRPLGVVAAADRRREAAHTTLPFRCGMPQRWTRLVSGA